MKENPEEEEDDDLGFKSEALSKDDDIGPITDYQIELVKNSWKEIVDKYGHEKIGEFWFKKIFESAPEILAQTPFKDEKPYLGGQIFLSSAYEFSKGFTKVVNKIDDKENLKEWLKEVGKRHKKRSVELHHY